MKKVAMILSQDLSFFNEDYRVFREAKTLIKAGYEVTVFCWAKGLDEYETKWEDEKYGVKFIRVFQDVANGLFSKGRSIGKAMQKLVTKIEEYKPDIIHAHNLDSLEAGFEASKLNPAKVIFDIHEDLLAL